MMRFAALMLAGAVCLAGCNGHEDVTSAGRGADADEDEHTIALRDLSATERAARRTNDLEAVRIYRNGLRRTVDFAREHPDLFPTEDRDEPRIIPREQKERIWSGWQSLLEYDLAITAVDQFYEGFYKLRGKAARRRAFYVAYAAFLARYRFALDAISLAEHDPTFDTLLNEPVPELGLPAGRYAEYKYHYLNVGRASEFAAMTALYRYYGEPEDKRLAEAMADDKAAIWKTGRGRGEVLTVKNGLNILKRRTRRVWFPVQRGVSEWMGDTKVYRDGRALITEEQIRALQPTLRPGDVMLTRREWYLSNVGLPGYWPHAMLYIGTPAERAAFFAGDAGVAAWLKEQGADSFEALLRTRYPEARDLACTPQEGHPVRVIEAKAEGVILATLEHAAAADSLCALRPRLPKVEIARGILRAFHYQGRPYDFDFNFLTDAQLVCTELVYKAYEPRDGMAGITWPVVKIMGRLALPANEIAKQFDRNFGTDAQQFDLLFFLDGDERQKAAFESDLAGFRQSWRRPKWHIVVKDTKLASWGRKDD